MCVFVAVTFVVFANCKKSLCIFLNLKIVGVAKGGFTTFLGTMTLAFSQSEAFRVFFLMFCGIVMISLLHGFLLIPSLLAEMPFIYWESEEAVENRVDDPVQRDLSIRTHSLREFIKSQSLRDELAKTESLRV